jgi:uncharacterized protein YodC (DUF2158 family)
MEAMGPGMTVKLKSGGPVMVITSLSSDKKIAECQWFDVTQTNILTASVQVLALTHADPPKGT